MGFGYGANYVDYVFESDIEKLCPTEYYALIEALKKNETNLKEFSEQICQGEYVVEEARNAWNALRDAFNQATTVTCLVTAETGGLELCIGYHESEAYGSRYDEVDGYYFCVYKAYKRTAAGEKFSSIFERRYFVSGG